MRIIEGRLIAGLVSVLLLSMISVQAHASVVGKISGDLTVSQGGVAYNLSLPLPNGIHDVSPPISLQYSAQATNGIVGPSFKLNASSAITRCTPTYQKDGFESGIQVDSLSRFCHDGQRLISVSGNDGQNGTEYRTYDNNNAKYQSIGGNNYTPERWIVNTPSGFELEFARFGHTDNQFATWLLVSKKDIFDNTITYDYVDGNLPLVSTISYSGHLVSFEYQDKNLPSNNYMGGASINNHKLLDRIDVNAPNGDLIYFFDFDYEFLQSAVDVERLNKVTQCFSGTSSENNSACLKPVSFHYQELPVASNVIDRLESDLTIVVEDDFYNPDGGALSSPIEERPSYAAGDVTGNGYPDFCYYKLNTGIVCAKYNAGSYDPPTAWSVDLAYQANNEDFKAYGLLNLIDLNLDGKSDVCITDDEGIRCGVSDGDSFNITSNSTSLWTTAINKSYMGVSFAYVNEDEYIDICGTDDNGNYRCYEGNGSSFSSELFSFNDVDFFAEAEWDYEYNCDESNSCSKMSESFEVGYPSPNFIDIDGDFDKDLCWVSHESQAFVCKEASTNTSTQTLEYGAKVSKVNLSSLTSTLPSTNSTTRFASVHNDWKQQAEAAVQNINKLASGFRLANLNGDQLLDVCYVSGEDYVCHLNTGKGFDASSVWLDLSDSFADMDDDAKNAKAATFRFVDRNLDGLADLCLIHSEYEQCGYSDGSELADLENRLKIFPDIEVNEDSQSQWVSFMHKLFGGSRVPFMLEAVRGGYGNLIEVGDINNDGFSEFCYRSLWGIACSTNDNFGPTSLLTGVTDSYGLYSQIEYAPLALDGLYDAANSIPTGFREQLSNNWVVSSITTDTATVNSASGEVLTNRVDYRYGGLLVSNDGEVAGFSKMTEIQISRNIVKTTNFFTDDKLFGQQESSVTQINGVTVKEQTNNMSVEELGNGTRRLVLNSTSENQYDANGVLLNTASTVNTEFDDYGYPKYITTNKTAGHETLEVKTETTYLHDLSNWLLGRADYQTVTHTYGGSDVETRVVDYEYTDGKLTREVLEPGADNQLTIEYSDFKTVGYPRLVESTGMSDYDGESQTRYVRKTYDDLGRVLTETNALNQTTTYTYHPRCGKIASIEDIGKRLTSIGYNEYCEKVSEDYPDSNLTTWMYEWATTQDTNADQRAADWEYSYHNPIVYKVTETKASDSEYGDQVSTVYFDALGRAVRSISSGFSSDSSDRDVKTSTIYDQYGYRVAITEPYYVLNGLQDTARWTRFTFDSVGRVSSESKAGPDKLPLTVSYTYSGNTSNIAYSDYSKSTTVGIHGKPSSVTENGQIVEYEYTAAGNLELTRTNNLETTVEYDDRGFKKSQEDPSMGEWQYKHNAFGELVYQKDAKQQEVKMYYDLLGRMTRKVAPEGTSRWDYFASGNGIGQLEQETGTEATKIWTYDELGRVETETLNVNTQTFTTQFVHDDYSRLIETKYPNDVSMFNRYDNIGKLQNVSMKARDIKNIDFEYLLAEKDTLMVELERLQSLQQAALNKAQYHSNKALEYHKQYREFLDKFNEVSQSISVLNDIAVEHQNRAEQYIALYSELIEKANSIKTQFGSGHRYKMIDQDSENYYYARTYCASYHGWGPTKYCARYNTDQVTVAISDLTITLANGDEQIIPAPEIIDPVTFFEGLAQRYLAQSLVQQQVVGTVIGSETDSSIIEKTVSELDQGTLDLVYEFIDRDAQIQLYELKKVLQDYIYADNNYDECEFNIDDFSEYYFKNQEYNRAIANCESAYQVYRENLAPLLNDQELFRATISAYQTGAGASEFEISTVQLLLDYIKDVSFYEITSLLRRSMYPNPVNEDGSFNREGVNSIDCSKFPGHQMLDAELPIYSERVASLKTQLLARESFFTNAEVLEKIKQLSIARVEIELLSHIDELLSSSNYCYVWGWGAIDLEGDRAPWESYFEDDLPAALNLFQALQTELNSYSVEEPINETYVGFEERMRDEERLIPIMVGDIVTFVPATVEVPYIHQWEMEVGEAQDFYEEKYKYYFGQMEAAVSSSASEISELDNGIDSDLATIEARLGAVDEALYVIDEDGAAALAQSQQDLNSTHGKLTLWHAAKRTPKGYLQTEIFGNGLYTHRDLDPETGLVEQINTAIVNGSSLRQLTYSYDDRGRIIDKTDTNDLGNTTTETFLYTDDQGRLSDWTFDQSIYNQPQYSLTYSYEHDERGNITRKTNAGIMTYDPLTNQLDSRSFEGSNFSYAYDANGNMLTGDGRSYVWASFNKAQSVTANGQTVSFKYDASQKRVVKTTSGETRYYVQPGYEYVKKGSEVIHRYTVWADGDAVAVIEKTDTVLEDEIAQAKTADKVSYIHRDILGSGELITDSRMQVVSRRYYSPYGSLIDDLIQDQKDQINHLDQETAVVAESSDVGADVWGAFEQEGEGDDLISRYIAAETMTELSGVRGFTSHESIDEIGLINMNARLYDPVIGRFTSADSMIPDIETPLDYNRYSYVRGNPVVSRDPTGHYGHIIAAILLYAASHYGDNPTWQMASSIILSATMMNPDVGVLGGSKMTVGVAMTRSAVTNLTMSFLQSGKIGRKSLENAAIAAASAGVTNGIAEGGWINNPDGYWHIGGSWALITATHMVSQGVIADLRGDKFIHGAVSALASKIGSYATRGFGDPLSIERTVVVATFGGLASRATGGDFAQGAIQAAMVHLFNELTSEQNGCPGCVEVTFKNGNKGWVPQSVMNSGVIMADQADATSLESYTTTTQKEYATAFSVVGTLTIPYYLVSGASAMGALWLDSESVTNLIGVLLLPAAPIAKFLDDAFFYGGKGFQGTVDTAGYANDAIDFTNTLSIPEKTN